MKKQEQIFLILGFQFLRKNQGFRATSKVTNRRRLIIKNLNLRNDFYI